MEDLSSLFSYQQSVEELKQRLVYMTYELQSAKMQAQEEVEKNKETMESTKELLSLLQIAHKERDEAREQIKTLLLHSNNSAAGRTNSGVTESNSLSGDDVVSPIGGAESAFIQTDPETRIIYKIAQGRPLPAKGKLLEAVMGAGPLLQTLMVAGPLPRWRNPPPSMLLQAGFDANNQGSRPHSAVPCGSSRFHDYSMLNFSAAGEFQSSPMCFNNSGVGYGSQKVPAPKRHRIQ